MMQHSRMQISNQQGWDRIPQGIGEERYKLDDYLIDNLVSIP